MPRGQGSIFPFPRVGRLAKAEEPPLAPRPAPRAPLKTLTKAERMLGEDAITRPATSQGHFSINATPPVKTVRKLRSQPSLMHVNVPDMGPQLDRNYALIRTDDMAEEFGLAFAGRLSPKERCVRVASSTRSSAVESNDGFPSLNSAEGISLRQPPTDSPMHSYFDLSKPFVSHPPQPPHSPLSDHAPALYSPTSSHYPGYQSTRLRGCKSPPKSPIADLAQIASAEKFITARKRPARLNFTKLFPKHKAESTDYLNSPNDSIYSPARILEITEQLSEHPSESEQANPSMYGLNSHPPAYSPALLNREEANSPAGNLALSRQLPPVEPSTYLRQRNFQQNIFESAKVNVRRPPKGIQNWFDGFLDSESSEGEDELRDTGSPHSVISPVSYHAPKESNRMRRITTSTPRSGCRSSSSLKNAASPSISFSSTSPPPSLFPIMHRLPSVAAGLPDTESVRSRESRASKLSNLKTRSVLSISDSSDSECGSPSASPKLPVVRDSVVAEDNGEDIVIGKAHAFEVMPRSSSIRQTTQGRSQQTHAHLIPQDTVVRDFGYSNTSMSNQRGLSSNGAGSLASPRFRSQWSGHTRQPSIIPEDDVQLNMQNQNSGDLQNRHNSLNTIEKQPSAVSMTSSRQDTSSVRTESLSHKMMMVTEEEEALLAMMRRKRAAMAKQSFTEGYQTALNISEHQGSEQSLQGLRVVRALEQSSMQCGNAETKPAADSFPNPTCSPPTRRPSIQSDVSVPSSVKSSDAQPSQSKPEPTQELPPLPSSFLPLVAEAYTITSSHRPASPPYHPPPEWLECLTFSSFDMLSRIVNEPTTPGSSHTSPSTMPSPMTPRRGSESVVVKVATSEPSTNGSTTDAIPGDTSVAIANGEQSCYGRKSRGVSGRPRTASSGADVVTGLEDRSRSYSRSSSVHTIGNSRSNRSSIANARSIDALHEAIKASKQQGHLESQLLELDVGGQRTKLYDESVKRSSQGTDKGGPIVKKEMCSVSEDVLAAWGSLGGWRDVGELRPI